MSSLSRKWKASLDVSQRVLSSVMAEQPLMWSRMRSIMWMECSDWSWDIGFKTLPRTLSGTVPVKSWSCSVARSRIIDSRRP
jgi:hypothetical protein